MLEVTVRTEIRASRADTWAVLSSLPDFEDWNPIIRRIDGELAVGSTITIHVDGPAGARPWDVEVNQHTPGTAFGWQFFERAPWLYRGEHLFTLEDSPTGVVLVDRERFWGVLVPFRRRGLQMRITASMQQMAAAFKNHVEQGADR